MLAAWVRFPDFAVEVLELVRADAGLARPLAGRRRLARMRSSGATSWPMRIAVTVVAVVAVAIVRVTITVAITRAIITVIATIRVAVTIIWVTVAEPSSET